MKTETRVRLETLTAMLILAFLAIQGAYAQTGGGIDLRWHVLSSGGTSYSTGGNAMLGGTLGQFGAGQSAGSSVALAGGFWNPDSGAPLAVDIAGFTAEADGDAIRLMWETVSEVDHLGFNVYRGPAPDGPWTQLNAGLIASPTPGATDGHAYEWLDADVYDGQITWYRLEAVDIHGGTQDAGFVSAQAGATAPRSKVWLPLLAR